jgi:hypothetical protein
MSSRAAALGRIREDLIVLVLPLSRPDGIRLSAVFTLFFFILQRTG